MRHLFRSISTAVVALLLLAMLGFGLLYWAATPDIGAVASGDRLDRMQQSPQWDGAAFHNPLPQVDGATTDTIRKEVATTNAVQIPASEPPVLRRTAADFRTLPESGLRVTWLGHSTLLIEQDGTRLLIDPVWGERASPWTSIGPQRFYPAPLALADLPPLHAVLISHDHYDHLDLPTVRALLRDRPELRWLVPLGIGAHLEHWGVPENRITELDWWESTEAGSLTLTATPARHFSGRWIDRFRTTLWVGWAIHSADHRVFFSGDTSLFPELEDIGERLGPFDLTIMDAGAYDENWTDVHLGPEQTVIAHQMVRGDVLLPVHWGLFDLANHGWTEPMERVLVAAERQGVTVRTPRPGGSIELHEAASVDRWWPTEPTLSASEHPAWSTSVDATLDRWWGPR